MPGAPRLASETWVYRVLHTIQAQGVVTHRNAHPLFPVSCHTIKERTISLKIRNTQSVEVFLRIGRNTMRSITRIFILAAISASATAALAQHSVEVNVPFRFETHGKIFPAGAYEVKFDQKQNALKLSGKTDTKISYTWIATPADSGPRAPSLSLKFDPGADGTHVLHSIRLDQWTTPVLDVRDRQVAQRESPGQ
jgi:hypothetical protein